MSESKCQINGNKIEPCAALAQSLEHDAEYTTRKGLLKYKIYNHELIHSQDLIMLRSGEFSKSPSRIEPGTTARIATKGDLMIVMFRQERAEKGESA